jgi:hypothetical protein
MLTAYNLAVLVQAMLEYNDRPAGGRTMHLPLLFENLGSDNACAAWD